MFAFLELKEDTQQLEKLKNAEKEIENLTTKLNNQSIKLNRFELIETKLADEVEKVRVLTKQNNELSALNVNSKKKIKLLKEQVSDLKSSREILLESLRNSVDMQIKYLELFGEVGAQQNKNMDELPGLIQHLRNLRDYNFLH